MRKIKIEFPCCGKEITATLLDDYEPKCAQQMWDFLETPKKAFVHPTISTGDLAVCWPRTPRERPADVGDQTTPMTDKSPYLCTGDDDMTVKLGDVLWNGYFFTFVYGDSLTEPLVSGGGKVARVEPECLEDLKIGGKDLWYHTIFYHTIGLVVASRKES